MEVSELMLMSIIIISSPYPLNLDLNHEKEEAITDARK
jgi:hypothetical protein